jgi:hypothetical protein
MFVVPVSHEPSSKSACVSNSNVENVVYAAEWELRLEECADETRHDKAGDGTDEPADAHQEIRHHGGHQRALTTSTGPFAYVTIRREVDPDTHSRIADRPR